MANTTALGPILRARALERLAARLTDGVLTVTASEHRSQWRNREAAQARLAATLRDALAPPPAKRRPTTPSKTPVRRRLDSKRRRGLPVAAPPTVGLTSGLTWSRGPTNDDTPGHGARRTDDQFSATFGSPREERPPVETHLPARAVPPL